ncbi:MAG: hypothetical protein IT269_03075 [Saprospiraceae bacterium]|nr:hypothetical protein [Saprospiraceae bacterium]
MNDLLKNPIVVFIAGLAALWLAFKLLKIFVSLFWLFALAFVILFFVNSRFRNLVRMFFNNIFNKN